MLTKTLIGYSIIHWYLAAAPHLRFIPEMMVMSLWVGGCSTWWSLHTLDVFPDLEFENFCSYLDHFPSLGKNDMTVLLEKSLKNIFQKLGT